MGNYTPSIILERDSKNYTFTIYGFENKLKSVYLADDLNKSLVITKNDKFTLTLSKEQVHAIFIIDIEGSKYTVGERTLKIDGMNNFRDMGGYPTESGKFVKWGLLYRSDHIYNASPSGLKLLKELGIKTIIDYRSLNEIKKYPNPVISNNIRTYNLDPNAHTAELAAQFTSDKKNEDENLVKKILKEKEKGTLINQYDIVLQQYTNFVKKEECKRNFAQMILLACEDNTAPMVQHCRGGKDRTGFGSMLLLGLLGVNLDCIIYDYMLTHYNRIKRNALKMEKYKKFTQDKQVQEYLLSLIDTKPEFIMQSYQGIVKDYGSLVNYAFKELGITEENINRLKELYLE